jgi:hypothetical protein
MGILEMKTFWLAATVMWMALSTSCLTVKQWSSLPPTQEISAPTFEALVEPIQPENHPYLDGFRLTLTNTSSQPLQIDWMGARYTLEGKNRGRFWFRGLSVESVNQAPPDTVAPGETLTRDIFPLALAARYGHASSNLKPGESPYNPGPLPPGQNGVKLVIKQAGEIILREASFTIATEARQ